MLAADRVHSVDAGCSPPSTPLSSTGTLRHMRRDMFLEIRQESGTRVKNTNDFFTTVPAKQAFVMTKVTKG